MLPIRSLVSSALKRSEEDGCVDRSRAKLQYLAQQYVRELVALLRVELMKAYQPSAEGSVEALAVLRPRLIDFLRSRARSRNDWWGGSPLKW